MYHKTYVHIIKLDQNKFFIFESSHDKVYKYINKLTKSSDWIQKYPFNSIMKDNIIEYNVNLWTLRYMYQFGIENVRGGIYNQLNLSNDTLIEIKNIINTFITLCECGKTNFKIGYYYMYYNIIRDYDNDGTEYDLFFKMQCNICNRFK